MGLAGRATRQAARLALLARTVQGIGHGAERPVGIRVLAGDPLATDRVREILGLHYDDELTPHAGLLVYAAVAGAEHDRPARALADRVEGEGPALALLVGPPEARQAMEERFLAEPGLGVASLAHVPTLAGPEGATMTRRAVVRALGRDGAVAVARRLPALRTEASRALAVQAAREAALLSAVGLVQGGAFSQVAMSTRLAAVNGRPLGSERAPEAAAVLVAGLVAGLLGRVGGPVLRAPGWVARGGVAYGSTLLLAQGLARWMAEGGEAADRPLTTLRGAAENSLGSGGGPAGARGGVLDRVRGVADRVRAKRGRT